VVSQLARDDLRLVGPALKPPIRPRRLERGLVRLGATGCEEEPVDARIGQARQPLGQLYGAGVRASAIARREPESRHLVARGIGQFLASMAQHHVPQPGEAVDVLPTFGVGHHGAVAPGPDVSRLVCRGIVQRVKQVGLVAGK
jgi:hypothetical protein